MKKIIAVLMIITAPFVAVLTSSFIRSGEQDPSAAKVDQVEGIYVFMLSKPTAAYETLGSIEKKGIVASGKPSEMLQLMVKKAKKEYPTTQGIIFTATDMYKADCVKFKP